jgi:hypothetical protein
MFLHMCKHAQLEAHLEEAMEEKQREIAGLQAALVSRVCVCVVCVWNHAMYV